MSGLEDGGGPAFPEGYDWDKDIPTSWGGMTLRDYFAGQALAGVVAMLAHPGSGGLNEDAGGPHKAVVAAQAYILADAMLAARDNKENDR